MLVYELIKRHVQPDHALHERGIRLNPTQVPSGVVVHHEAAEVAPPVADDVLLVSTPIGPGLPEHIDTDLPVGVTVVLLLETELTDLPVDRVLAALAVARLQVVEAEVVSDAATATVAVVAIRTDELVAPEPSLADSLEPGDHSSQAVLRRVLGEHALEGLVWRARERQFHAEAAADLQAREALARDLDTARGDLDTTSGDLVTARGDLETVRGDLETTRGDLETTRGELETTRGDLETTRADLETTRADLETARRDLKTVRTDLQTAHSDLQSARTDLGVARDKLQALRASPSFKVASRIALAWRIPRRIARRRS